MAYYPSPEQVGIAWMLATPVIDANAIATTLPNNPATWAPKGFIQVRVMSGGGVVHSAQIRTTVLQVDCWGTNLESMKPPWGKASQLASQIWDACEDDLTQNKKVVIKAGFHEAVVYSVRPVSEIRRFIPGIESQIITTRDPSTGFARIQFEVAMSWKIKKVA